MTRRTALATALAAAPPGAAGAAIEPGAGIAGVSLGQAEAEVRDSPGRPARVLRGAGAFGRELLGRTVTRLRTRVASVPIGIVID